MFDNLSDKLERAFKVLKGHGQITEINVAETLKEVRRALLEADVSFKQLNFYSEYKRKSTRSKCADKYLSRTIIN